MGEALNTPHCLRCGRCSVNDTEQLRASAMGLVFTARAELLPKCGAKFGGGGAEVVELVDRRHGLLG